MSPRTKIICTIGPASDNASVLRSMIRSGMDVARLNFSHGTHQEHARRIILIRQLSAQYRRTIGILQDLEGYRIRIGRLKGGNPILLKRRRPLFLVRNDVIGEGEVVPFDYTGDFKDIKAGAHIYIDDGTIALTVKESTRRRLRTEVVVGGLLKENKGINIAGIHLKFRGLTAKDKDDLAFGISRGVEYVAQSFVRTAADMKQVRDFIGTRLPGVKLIAKIENRQGIENIDGIIKISDGIMIARGDMGVCIPIYEVPLVQKRIIRKCNLAGKFVITATQMLESMTERVRPTRAEVTDVANAILDGTDFVMLSAESAAGNYPVEAVRMMEQIIRFTEERTALLNVRVVV